MIPFEILPTLGGADASPSRCLGCQQAAQRLDLGGKPQLCHLCGCVFVRLAGADVTVEGNPGDLLPYQRRFVEAISRAADRGDLISAPRCTGRRTALWAAVKPR